MKYRKTERGSMKYLLELKQKVLKDYFEGNGWHTRLGAHLWDTASAHSLLDQNIPATFISYATRQGPERSSPAY